MEMLFVVWITIYLLIMDLDTIHEVTVFRGFPVTLFSLFKVATIVSRIWFLLYYLGVLTSPNYIFYLLVVDVLIIVSVKIMVFIGNVGRYNRHILANFILFIINSMVTISIGYYGYIVLQSFNL